MHLWLISLIWTNAMCFSRPVLNCPEKRATLMASPGTISVSWGGGDFTVDNLVVEGDVIDERVWRRRCLYKLILGHTTYYLDVTSSISHSNDQRLCPFCQCSGSPVIQIGYICAINSTKRHMLIKPTIAFSFYVSTSMHIRQYWSRNRFSNRLIDKSISFI